MTTPTYDANDILFGGGIPSAKFEHPGDNFGGPITKLEAVQQRKFDKGKPTNELDFWDDGTPKMMAVATVRTQHRDATDPSDDGQRKIYIAGRDLQGKIRVAVRNAGRRKLDIGDVLSVTFVGEEKQESGLYAKIYEVSYTPGNPAAEAANAALGIQSAPAPAPVQAFIPPVQQLIPPAAPVAQPAPVAAPAATVAPTLDSLPPEARALVEKMLAGQQSA